MSAGGAGPLQAPMLHRLQRLQLRCYAAIGGPSVSMIEGVWNQLVKLARAVVTVVLALGVLAAPLAAAAQGAGKPRPRIGYLSGGSDSASAAAFRQGLRELGYIDGQNIAVEFRFAEGKYEKLPAIAIELVRLDVAVIVASTTPAIHAAQRATRTIPIVMTLGEATEATIVSLACPGGNITGLATINTELSGKRLELLKEALPRLSRVALVLNPTNPDQPDLPPPGQEYGSGHPRSGNTDAADRSEGRR